jgi:hypothetical protein
MDNKTTRVVGFFNPQAYPVGINSSQLGLSMTIKPKEFVLDRSGQKINDPRLEAYVAPGMLAREMSAADVPVRTIMSGLGAQTAQSISPSTGFTATNKTPPISTPGNAKARQAIAKPAPTPPAAKQPPANGNPVRAMSVDDAKRLGYIRPTHKPVEGPKDDAMNPQSAIGAPPIEFARDVPGKNPAAKPAPVVIEKKDGVVAQLIETAKVDYDDPNLIVNVAKSVMKPEATKPAAVEPVGDPADDPRFTEVQSPASSKAAELPDPGTDDDSVDASTARFICHLDGRGFDYRSQLERWAKRKYPAQVAEIMAPYPPISVTTGKPAVS